MFDRIGTWIIKAYLLCIAGVIGAASLGSAMQMHEKRQRCEGPQAWAFIECAGIATLPPILVPVPEVKP